MSVDQSPVYAVKAVPLEKIVANDYNPNIVAPPEMKLLELSIWEDGFTMPCVCYRNGAKNPTTCTSTLMSIFCFVMVFDVFLKSGSWSTSSGAGR